MLAIPVVLGAAGIACDGDNGTGPLDRADITGFWAGTADGVEREDDRQFELLLLEKEFDEDDKDNVNGDFDDDDDFEGAKVEGSGSITGRNSAIAVIVEGTVVFADVSLTLISEEFTDGKQLINFQGEFVSGDVILGKLNGGGFVDERLRLRRTERRPLDP